MTERTDAVRAHVEAAMGAPLNADEATWLAGRLVPMRLAVGQPYVREGTGARASRS